MPATLALYALAALAEISGCFAFWQWLRRDAASWVLAPGLVALVLFAVLLTRVDSAAAGRAYAAYGGIYIVCSVLWLRIAEGVRPTGTDLLGAALCLAGTIVILTGVRR